MTAKKVPLFRDIGFAERERDLLIAYFSSFFPLVFRLFDWVILYGKSENVKYKIFSKNISRMVDKKTKQD